MKKLSILILAICLFGLYSCKKDETKVVLTSFTPAQLQTPASGSAYILTIDKKDSVLFKYTWIPAAYNLTDVVPPTYTVEMDTAGGSFAKPTVIATTKNTTFIMNVGTMNTLILGSYKGIPDKLATFEFRVKTSLVDNAPSANNYSAIIEVDMTPYSAIVVLPPIYLLGDATTVAWDNTKALEMTHIGDAGKYVIVEHLVGPGKFIKFIADQGAWEPMWGLGATGTWESGDLKYRKVGDPDPPAIPSPEVEGDYWIMADTANLLYEVSLTSSQLFLVGDATTAGWDNTKGIPFDKVSPGIFTLTTTLTAGGMKFLEVLGQWAPQWGTDAAGTSNFGPLVYRPTESVPDPTNIVSPGAGTYTIELNLATKAYKITAK